MQVIDPGQGGNDGNDRVHVRELLHTVRAGDPASRRHVHAVRPGHAAPAPSGPAKAILGPSRNAPREGARAMSAPTMSPEAGRLVGLTLEAIRRGLPVDRRSLEDCVVVLARALGIRVAMPPDDERGVRPAERTADPPAASPAGGLAIPAPTDDLGDPPRGGGDAVTRPHRAKTDSPDAAGTPPLFAGCSSATHCQQTRGGCFAGLLCPRGTPDSARCVQPPSNPESVGAGALAPARAPGLHEGPHGPGRVPTGVPLHRDQCATGRAAGTAPPCSKAPEAHTGGSQP